MGSERQFEKQQKQKPNLTLFSRNDTRRRSALDPRVRYAVSTPSPTYPSSPPGPPKVCSFTFLRSRRGGNAHAQADVTKSFLPHARTHTLIHTHTQTASPRSASKTKTGIYVLMVFGSRSPVCDAARPSSRQAWLAARATSGWCSVAMHRPIEFR